MKRIVKKSIWILSYALMVMLGCARMERTVSAAVEGFSYEVVDGQAVITEYTGADLSVVVPSTLNDHPVVKIGNSTFENMTEIISVELPEGLETIGNRAFAKCSGLLEISLPSTLKYIGNEAFAECSSLLAVDLPLTSTLKNIGSKAFFECSSLKEMVFSNSLISIRDYAFQDCSSLTEIIFPSSLETIGWYAFERCDGLKKVEIPDNVKGEILGWFYQCSNLEEIVIGSGITAIPMLSKYAIPDFGSFEGLENLKKVQLSEGLETIGAYTFRGCTQLSKIVFPSSLETIGEYAFERCNGLKNVEIPDNVRGELIGWFYNCSNLEEIKIGAGITAIPMLSKYAIPDFGSFEGLENLKKVQLSEGLETIGAYTFRDCSGLCEIIFPCSLKSIGKYAFESCHGLRKIEIPDNVKGEIVGWFYNCSNLEEIKIGSGITAIPMLSKYAIPDFGSFDGLKNLKKIHFSEGLETIGAYTFRDCIQLSDIIFPSSLKSIGNHAFKNCTSIKKLELPISLKSSALNAFEGCSGLQKVIIPGPMFDTFSACFSTEIEKKEVLSENNFSYVVNEDNTITIVKYIGEEKDLTIPNIINGKSVKAIESLVFEGNTNLKSITISEGVKEIGAKVFSDCTLLNSVTLPSSLERIGEYAFNNCKSLKEIVIPDKVTGELGRWFRGCATLEKVTVGKGITAIVPWAFNGSSFLENVILPDGLKKIGYQAFKDCSVLKEIVLPEGLKTIGRKAFDSCTSLESITIPDSVTGFVDMWFSKCTKLKSVKLGMGIQSIGAYAFQGLENLNSVELSIGLQSIGYKSFDNTIALEEITFPITLKDLNQFAFGSGYEIKKVNMPSNLVSKFSTNSVFKINEIPILFDDNYLYKVNTDENVTILGCIESVTDLVIPDSIDGKKVTALGEHACSYMPELRKIILPEGIEEIESRAFYGSKSLEEITLPSSLKSIGDYTFGNNAALTVIMLQNGIVEIGNGILEGCGNLKDICYAGTEEEWTNIQKKANSFSDIQFHYNVANICEGIGHDLKEEILLEPTCSDKGTKKCTCSRCASEYNEDIPLIPHEFDAGVITKEATCTANGAKTYTCKNCSNTKSSAIAKKAHIYKDITTPATLWKNGNVTPICTLCKHKKAVKSIIYRIKSVKLSPTSFTYNGIVKKPSVIVKNSKGRTISASNYTIRYNSGCKNVGRYKVQITFKGKYSGSKSLFFDIRPSETSFTKMTSGSKKISVKWSKQSQVSGYSIQYSTSPKFTNVKTTTLNYSRSSVTFNKLAGNQKYYLRIRTYRTLKVNGKKVALYSDWSNVKVIRTKK